MEKNKEYKIIKDKGEYFIVYESSMDYEMAYIGKIDLINTDWTLSMILKAWKEIGINIKEVENEIYKED